jgi:hypothetical protein
VVCCGDDEVVRLEAIKQLKKTIDHPLEFPMFGRVIAALADSVKVIKQEHPVTTRGEVENFAEVGCGLAEKRRDYRVKANDQQGETELVRNDLGTETLAGAGWATEEESLSRA